METDANLRPLLISEILFLESASLHRIINITKDVKEVSFSHEVVLFSENGMKGHRSADTFNLIHSLKHCLLLH